MGFFDKFFGKRKKSLQREEHLPNKEEESSEIDFLPETAHHWEVPIVDLRPLTQSVMSTSENKKMAENSVSYGSEDGLVFLNNLPAFDKHIDTAISFTTDGKLQNGALYLPGSMDYKWAIFYHKNMILFVRSWLREVTVVAHTEQNGDELVVKKVSGQFTTEESSSFTSMFLEYLIYSHVIHEIVPAPLPKGMDLNEAAYWAFSAYGKMALLGHFEESFNYQSNRKLRSHSLLHIAIAKGERDRIIEMLNQGMDINLLAADGLSTLHWALDPGILEFLLGNGANPDVKSIEGATPLMNAVQSQNAEHFDILLKYGADVNARDLRGFTSMHRAAEMGHEEMVVRLLQARAEKSPEAEGHTPLSLAKLRKNDTIIRLLEA